MAEEHAIGGGERQCVTGAFFPAQMPGAFHKLAILHAAELCERSIRRLVTPDALAGREHRIAAIAFLVVAIVLIAVDDHFIANLPARHLRANGPHDARGIGACDVIGILVSVDRRDRHAEPRPHAVVIHARRHHENQHVMAVQRPGRHDLKLEGLLRRPMALFANRPGVHVLRHMAERRDFADVVKILVDFERRLGLCR